MAKKRVKPVKMYASVSIAKGEGIISASFYRDQAGHDPQAAVLMMARDYREMKAELKRLRSIVATECDSDAEAKR